MPESKFAGGLSQDREIRFDCPLSCLAPCPGEREIDSINSVEDTKGNNGERGAISATNLRIIWCSHKSPRTNLSIGYNTILNLTIRNADSRLRGETQALFLMCKFDNTRFEFIFTSLVRQSPRLFITVQSIFRSYETTKLYRDLKLRGAIIEDKQLILLPQETVSTQYRGVWNLSSEQGNLGVFVITNIRIVWFAELAENFNVSVPYLQIKSIKTKKKTRFGRVLVIDTVSRSGGYVLGFRIHPQELLETIVTEMNSLKKTFQKDPIFGIDVDIKNRQLPLDNRRVELAQETTNITTNLEHNNLISTYFATGKAHDREPVFNESLGLAVEKLRDGETIDGLWSMKMPTQVLEN